MAADEDLLLWLTEKLTLERQALREQHWLQQALLEERHLQLLAATQLKLGGAPCNLKEGSDGVASHSLVSTSGSTPASGARLSARRHSQDIASGSSPKSGRLSARQVMMRAVTGGILEEEQMQDGASQSDSPLPPDVSPPQVAAQDSTKTAGQEFALSIFKPVTSLAVVTNKFIQTVRSLKNKALNNFDEHQRSSAYRMSIYRGQQGSCLSRVAKSPYFELMSGLAILLNTLILACEIEYNGYDSGHSVAWLDYRPSEESWPDAESWFAYLDIAFVGFFALELLMRIGADRLQSLRSGWLWFDTFVVVASVLSLVQGGSGSVANLDPTLLRIARLARFMRVFKMIRFVKAFDSWFLLIKSIQASVGALAWSFMLLIFVEVAVGMCLSQMLQQYIQEDQHDIEKRREVFLLYGTFTRTMVTMFEITLGNWVPSCRILMDYVSEWFGLFYILYCCCFIFAVIRVIQAVFIAETNRVVANDDHIAVMRKQREKSTYLAKLHRMFEELDVSGDGCLSRDEIQNLGEDKLLKAMMSTLDINVHDLDVLFDLLDDGDGLIDIDEFIKGLSRVKGGAQSVDVVSLLRLTRKLDMKIDHIIETSRCEALAKSLDLSASSLRRWIVRL